MTETVTGRGAPPDAAEQYAPSFVDRWDDLIDWDRRQHGEQGFFARTLAGHGVRTVLDAAAGTGYHSVTLAAAGFEVTSVDTSAVMLRRAEANARARGVQLRAVHADWRALDRALDGQFDAIVCLGSSFPHLFEERDRVLALRQFHARLRPGGLLVVDHRNFDAIRRHRYASSGRYYYCGTGVTVSIGHVDERVCRFRYQFADQVHQLEVYPILTEELGGLLERSGFRRLSTLGDFHAEGDLLASDFVIHVARKEVRR